MNESTDWCDTQSGWIEQAAFDSAWRLIVEQVCRHSPGQDAHLLFFLCMNIWRELDAYISHALTCMHVFGAVHDHLERA